MVLAVSIVNHLRFIFYAQRLHHLRRSDLSSDTACPTYFEIVVCVVHLEGPMRGESLMPSCTRRVWSLRVTTHPGAGGHGHATASIA